MAALGPQWQSLLGADRRRGLVFTGPSGDRGSGGDGGANSMELDGTACRGKGSASRPAKDTTVAATRRQSKSWRSERGRFCTWRWNKSMTVTRSQNASRSASLAPERWYACPSSFLVLLAVINTIKFRGRVVWVFDPFEGPDRNSKPSLCGSNRFFIFDNAVLASNSSICKSTVPGPSLVPKVLIIVLVIMIR